MKFILSTGSRDFPSYDVVYRSLRRLQELFGPEVWLIEGGAEGSDKKSRVAVESLGWCGVTTKRILANGWKVWGKRIGPWRNTRMLDDDKPDYIVAFHDDLSRSKGTKDCVAQAKYRGIHGELINSAGEVVETW